MPFATILYEVEGPIATIAFNRPERLNAFNAQLMDELHLALDGAERDEAVRVVVIKGVGRAFSSGVDLGREQPVPTDPGLAADHARLSRDLQRLLRIWDFPKPVIAQVHGWCIAGGTMLPIFCDLTIVSADCRIRWPALPIGGGYIGPLWTWLIGPKKAKEMSFIAGSEMTGAEAQALGWANHAVPEAELEATTRRLAHAIARTPPDLLRLKKRAINRVMEEQGFRTAVMFGAEWDSIAHHTAGADAMRTKLRELGLKEAIAWFNSVQQSDPNG